MADAPGVRHFLTLSVIGPGAVLTEVVFILNALGRWARRSKSRLAASL